MVKFFKRFLIVIIFSFPILYSSNSNAAKLTCECQYVTIESIGSDCNVFFPPMDIQTFLLKDYIIVNNSNFEITTKNEDEIIAIEQLHEYLYKLINIDRNNGKTFLTIIATQDLSWNDEIIKKGPIGTGVFQCSKKKDKLF